MIEPALDMISGLRGLANLSQGMTLSCLTATADRIYRNGECVVHAYTELHLDLITELYMQDRVCTLIKWIENQRVGLMPVRTQMQRLTSTDAYRPRRTTHSSIDQFRQGILGMLQGCLSLVEEDHYRLNPYGYRGPTLLDHLYRQAHQPVATHRALYVKTAKKQFLALHRAWEEAVEGYTATKYECRYDRFAALTTAPQAPQSACLTVTE